MKMHQQIQRSHRLNTLPTVLQTAPATRLSASRLKGDAPECVQTSAALLRGRGGWTRKRQLCRPDSSDDSHACLNAHSCTIIGRRLPISLAAYSFSVSVIKNEAVAFSSCPANSLSDHFLAPWFNRGIYLFAWPSGDKQFVPVRH